MCSVRMRLEMGRVKAVEGCVRLRSHSRRSQPSATLARHCCATPRICCSVPATLWASDQSSQAARSARCCARAEAAGKGQTLAGQTLDAAYVAVLFAVWYLANIYFNIYNKQVLSAFPHPITCTWIHLLVGSALACALWLTRLKGAPTMNPRVVDIVFPLSVLHLVGFTTTNASLGAVAVSLTHTIKAMEPFFTVFFSWLLLGIQPAKRVLASLVPIVCGVCVASATDISFNWLGFSMAMVSNLAFQSRNVLSKKAMLRTSLDSLEGGSVETAELDEVNIFALMSIGAFLLMAPFVFLADSAVLANGLAPATWMSPDLWSKLLLAGCCRFGDVLASFLILQKVLPVTHSVGNCVKRVVVIAASIVVFNTPASATNIVGTALALSGVLLYSFAKRSKPDNMDIDKAVRSTGFENVLASVSPGTLYSNAVAARRRREKREKPASDSEPEYYL